MDEQNLLQGIMIGLLLAGIYLGGVRVLYRNAQTRRAMPVISVIMLVFFVVLAVILFLVSGYFGTGPVLMAMLFMITLLIFYGIVVYLVNNFRQIHMGALIIFALYVLAVVYITILSRNTTGDHSSYLLRMDMLAQALQTHSLIPIRHILQNVALFIPVGILLPWIDREKLDHFLYPTLFALAFSVLIESIQLYCNLGQADLTDIVANVLGAMLGYLVFCMLDRMIDPIEEDEDT